MEALKAFIVKQYTLDKSDYKTCPDLDERFDAFRDMLYLKLLAYDKFGSEFADSLDNL